ncbi:MAG: hypothetical protein ACXIT9_07535 [Nitritalea sp.]
MKKLLLALLVPVLLLMSCGADDEPGVSLLDGSWTLEDASFEAAGRISVGVFPVNARLEGETVSTDLVVRFDEILETVTSTGGFELEAALFFGGQEVSRETLRFDGEELLSGSLMREGETLTLSSETLAIEATIRTLTPNRLVLESTSDISVLIPQELTVETFTLTLNFTR